MNVMRCVRVAELKGAYDLVIVNDELNTAAAALEGFLFEVRTRKRICISICPVQFSNAL